MGRRTGMIRTVVCEAACYLADSFSLFKTSLMHVGAVGNGVVCGCPSPCGRILGVRRDGSVYAPHSMCAAAESAPHRERRIDSSPRSSCRRRAATAGDIAQREPNQLRGGLVIGKWPRVLMILRRRAWTLSSAFVV